jgi:ligand-binding sensor domain-containing protein/signal transduction histidine kinase
LNRPIPFLVSLLAAALILGHPARADSPFVVDAWSTADGLPQSSVIAITQTRDGYLWLGTLNGLVRFDGDSMTPFNVNNTPGLPDNVIVFLYEDSRTNLWVGTHNGALGRLQDGVLKNVFSMGGANGKITAAFEDAEHALWFATDGADDFCWRDGVLERVADLPWAFRSALSDLALHASYRAADGSLWTFKNRRLQQWRGDHLGKDFSTPWGDAVVTAICADEAGHLVVGTRGSGVFWLDNSGGFQHLTKNDGLSEDYVLSLCFDSAGDLWVGTDGGGLDRVKRKIFSTPAELGGGVALSAAEDAQSGLWASFNLRGLTYWLTNSVRRFTIGQESKAGPVLVDQQGRVWAGTSGEGLFQFVDGHFISVPASSVIGPQIYALFLARDGRLWVGGRSGLASFDGKVWRTVSAADGLPPFPIRALAEDDQGGLWIGTGGGLYHLSANRLVPVPAPVSDIACLLVDRDGALWVGTSAHGLACFRNGNWFRFTKADGLMDDIGYLIEDGLGNFWIGSYEGLLRVPKHSLTDFATDHSRRISARTLLTRECSAGAQPAAIQARDGTLWFPTTEGFVSINPLALKPNTNPPPVVIESVAVDGVDLNTNRLSPGWSGSVRLTPANEQLDIHFASLDFSAPKGVQFGARFRYRLQDQAQKERENWTDIATEHVAHFPKLQPGAYTFHVQACNEDGYWNETGASLAIVVEPPFWRKPGFLAAAAVSFIAVLAGTIYLISTAKLKRQLRAAQQKEMVEQERARIARDLHDQLGANLTQITLLGEMAETDKELPGEIEQHAQQICATARDTTRSLDEIVWAVNPSNDTLASLANYACKYAQDYFAMAGVSYRADLPSDLPPTPILPEVRHNVFLAFKEAVNNVVKHARATEAHVKLELVDREFVLSVSDNGRGIGDLSGKNLRNGLKNMRRRLADVHGRCEIVPGPHSGTVVRLTVPVKISPDSV